MINNARNTPEKAIHITLMGFLMALCVLIGLCGLVTNIFSK